MERIVLVIGILAVLALAMPSAAVASTTAPAPSPRDVIFQLYGSRTAGWGFSAASESMPGPTFTVNQGDTITLVLTSTDGVPHQFFIDYNGNAAPDAGEPTSAAFTTTVNLTFTASTAGTFSYYCVFHPMMTGTWVTVAPPPPASPEIHILFPLAGSVLSTVGTRVETRVANFTLSNGTGPCSGPATGRYAIYLNGVKAMEASETNASLWGVPATTTRLGVQLLCTDGSPLNLWDNLTVTAGNPEIVLDSPRPVAGVLSLSTLGTRLRYHVSNFSLDPLDVGGPSIPGQGHVHIYYNTTAVLRAMGLTGTTDLVPLPSGAFRLILELHNNDHSLVTTAAAPTGFRLNLSAVGTVPSIAASVPTTIPQGQPLVLRWTVNGFVLDSAAFGGPVEPGHGHVHIFLITNGSIENYLAATAGTEFVLGDLAPGTYTYKVELYNNDHTELPTEYSSTVTIQVLAPAVPEASVGATLFYAGTGLLLAIVVILAALLVRSRRGGRPGTEPPKAGGGPGA